MSIMERDDSHNEKLMTYQGTHTASWAVFIDDPELRMYLKRIEDNIDVLSVAILELLQDFDLVHGDLDRFILC